MAGERWGLRGAPRDKLTECILDKILVHSLEDKSLSEDSYVLKAFLYDLETMRIWTVWLPRPLPRHRLVRFPDLLPSDSSVTDQLCTQH